MKFGVDHLIWIRLLCSFGPNGLDEVQKNALTVSFLFFNGVKAAISSQTVMVVCPPNY